MPASRKASLGVPSGSVVMKTLPGCRSPCTKLCTNSIWQNASMPALHTSCRSYATEGGLVEQEQGGLPAISHPSSKGSRRRCGPLRPW
eukprot:scaffold148946_cov35-Tisochrysis_lutea.AAC.2